MFGKHTKNRQEWEEQLAMSRSARRLRDALKKVDPVLDTVDIADDILQRYFEALDSFNREEAIDRRPRPRPQPTTTSVPVMPGWIVQ
jgi:hypothetical protein